MRLVKPYVILLKHLIRMFNYWYNISSTEYKGTAAQHSPQAMFSGNNVWLTCYNSATIDWQCIGKHVGIWSVYLVIDKS